MKDWAGPKTWSGGVHRVFLGGWQILKLAVRARELLKSIHIHMCPIIQGIWETYLGSIFRSAKVKKTC